MAEQPAGQQIPDAPILHDAGASAQSDGHVPSIHGSGPGATMIRASTQERTQGGGTTTVGEGVVTKVAGIAASEVAGVYALGSSTARAVGSLTSRVGLSDERTQGVSVEVGETEAAVDLTVVIEYGESIPKVANAIRENIVRRIEAITGLKTTEVNITVNDLHFAGDDRQEERSVRVQ
jgi:uncharacterized alkaline shock family protein YloU